MRAQGFNLNEVTTTVSIELSNLSDWMRENKLTINPRKTELLLISNRIHNNDNISVNFMNEQVFCSSSAKYLGVHLDYKLSFKEHISDITKKIARHTGILYKIKENLPLKARLNYYYGHIYPYLNYNILIWGGACANILKPLITQHKRTIRIISDVSFRDHTDPLFKNLNILKIEDIYRLNLVIHVHKTRAQGAYQISHQVNTRNTNLANPTFHRLAQTQRAVSYAGPTTWNNLPDNIRRIDKLIKFKSETRKFFINRYGS